jgi:uncharacterized Fe-S cluster-containing protein
LGSAREFLGGEASVAASVAPSFAALFPGPLAFKLPSALRTLGFSLVAETAAGAEFITERSFEENGGSAKGTICSTCPAVTSYVEKYRPELTGELIPVVSPMVAHARLLKKETEGLKVVFIGPCAAKKEEAARAENRGAVDCVLTFAELLEWLKETGVSLADCPESSFDNTRKADVARLFPLEGGMLKTGGLALDPAGGDLISVSGHDAILALLSEPSLARSYKIVEPLFCQGGCLGGPALPLEASLFERQKRLVAYYRAAKDPEKDPAERRDAIEARASFVPAPKAWEEIGATQVEKILAKMGKSDPAFRLNCGACGYKTCSEQAEAIARGMAETEMCIPYTRRLAQQRTDRIIETMPNGIVILDAELRILKMNPSFQKMFMCNNAILGRRISYLLNAEGFESLSAQRSELFESIRSKYGVRYHEILYALRDEEQYVGVFADVSKIKFDSGQLDVIKRETLLRAREFLDHQIRFAQEMAHFLGKSTARSEEIAKQIIDLYPEA